MASSDPLKLSGPSNAEQIDYWNVRGAAAWVPLQERMDAMLEPLGRLMLDAAELERGQRVLDVGCGCGATTVEAAHRVGPNGHVVGMDVSAPMLERARQRSRQLAQVRFVEADAQTTDIGSLGVDRLISRFGVMFFADLAAAFVNLRTAMARRTSNDQRGRLAFVTWQSPKQNPMFTFAGAAVADLMAPSIAPPAGPNAPGPFALADHARIAQVLFGAGFSDVNIVGHEVALDFGGGGTVDELVQFAIDLGPIGRAIVEDPSLDAPIRETLGSTIELSWSDGTVELPAAVWVVTASV